MLRFRDLILVLVGLLGIILSLHLIFSHSSRTRAREAREDSIRQHALHEKRVQEVERQAQEEKKRLEAEREQQLWEAQQRRIKEEGEHRQKLLEEQRHQEAQKKKEEEERRQREAQERIRRQQLEELRQTGVRSVDISAVSADPFRSVGVWLKVNSEPSQADIFLNWTHKGHTPLWLNSIEVSGLMVIVKSGYRPFFRKINYRKDGELTPSLSVEESYSPTRFLLLPRSGTTSHDAFYILRTQLVDAGFSTPGMEEVQEFERAERDAGGLSNKGLRTWARAQFNTDVLIRASIQEQNRELGAQSQVLAGAVRSLVAVDLDLYDLRSGDHLTTISVSGSAFSLDQAQSFVKALKAATADAVEKIKTSLVR